MSTQDTRPVRTLHSETDSPVSLTPVADVYESEQEYLVVAELPGVAPEALTVELHNGELTVEGSREGIQYRRVFRVPDGTDPNALHAELDRGLLRLHLPKPAEARPRRITIQAGA